MFQLGCNNDKPCVELMWRDLEPLDSSKESRYRWRRECPFCKPGILALIRDSNGILKEEDYCLMCGQTVVYSDIDAMRAHDHGFLGNGGYG